MDDPLNPFPTTKPPTNPPRDPRSPPRYDADETNAGLRITETRTGAWLEATAYINVRDYR